MTQPPRPAQPRLPALPALPNYAQDLGHGVYAIDTAFQRDHFDAAYLMVDSGRAAFIDTGTRHAVPRLLGTLAAVGLAVEAVDWVIPTHVHLDHAGGVGPLMQALPSARLLVHPRGLRHMVDPSALWAGALAVYGETEMQRSYGTLVGVPESRTVASSDEQQVRLGGRTLRLIDTPGHARHHHCIWDETSGGWFTGDTFGLSYREFDDAQGLAWILPTSTPVQFEPEALVASIQRMLQTQPRRMFLTHYGAVGRDAADVQRLADLLIRQIQAMARIALALQDAPDRHAALKRELLALYQRGVATHLSRDVGDEGGDEGADKGADDADDTMPPAQVARLLEMDVELNAQGLGVWLDKQRKQAQEGPQPTKPANT